MWFLIPQIFEVCYSQISQLSNVAMVAFYISWSFYWNGSEAQGNSPKLNQAASMWQGENHLVSTEQRKKKPHVHLVIWPFLNSVAPAPIVLQLRKQCMCIWYSRSRFLSSLPWPRRAAIPGDNLKVFFWQSVLPAVWRSLCSQMRGESSWSNTIAWESRVLGAEPVLFPQATERSRACYDQEKEVGICDLFGNKVGNSLAGLGEQLWAPFSTCQAGWAEPLHIIHS